jgi:hypothetical protein
MEKASAGFAGSAAPIRMKWFTMVQLVESFEGTV